MVKNDKMWLLLFSLQKKENEKISQGFFILLLTGLSVKRTKVKSVIFLERKQRDFFILPADSRMNHHSRAAIDGGDNMRSWVPRFTFKWNQMAVHSEMIYSNDDGNKSKVLFHIGPAAAWNCCRSAGIFRYSQWVMSLLCQDYYLNVSTSRFISILPKRLNVVSNQPCSSLGFSVCRVAEWGL